MGRRILRLAACLFVAGRFFSSAVALDIQLFDVGSSPMSAAQLNAFNMAAGFWESRFSDPITVKVNIAFDNLDPGILGSTRSQRTTHPLNNVRSAMLADSFLTENASVALLPSSSLALADINGNRSDTSITMTTANAKALSLGTGLDSLYGGALPNSADGEIKFANAFASSFDYDRSDGISAGSTDFISVAAHEIGHALGFISQADVQDINAGFTLHANTLDLWRFSETGAAHTIGTETRQMTAGPAEYYDNVLNNVEFSRGKAVVDAACGTSSGRCQASHWRDDLGNLMDPTLAPGVSANITSQDVHAFDYIGYNRSLILWPWFPRDIRVGWFLPPIPFPCLNCPPIDFPEMPFDDFAPPPSFDEIPKPEFTPNIGFQIGLDFGVEGMERRSGLGWAEFQEEMKNPDPVVINPARPEEGEQNLLPAVEPVEILPPAILNFMFQSDAQAGLPFTFRDMLPDDGAQFDPSLGEFGGYRIPGVLDGIGDRVEGDVDGKMTILLLADREGVPNGQSMNFFVAPEGEGDSSFVSLDPAAIGTPLFIVGDANMDTTVDLRDFNILKSNFGENGASWNDGDFSNDGSVDLTDFNLQKGNFGFSLNNQQVPEPTALLLLAIGGGILLCRRRSR